MEDTETLPIGWVKKFNEAKQKYYYVNKVTKQTQWNPPEINDVTEKVSINQGNMSQNQSNNDGNQNESSEWEEKYSEKHKKRFWKNKRTGESSWKDPMPASQSTPTNNNQTSIKPFSNETQESQPSSSSSSEWEELFSDKHQKKYWKHKVTNEKSWKEPSSSTNNDTSSAGNQSRPESTAESAVAGNVIMDWEEKYSEKHKKKFWKNKVTGESSWKDPTPATTATDISASPVKLITESNDNDLQWEEKYSEKHKKKFWKNKVTGESSWKDPITSSNSASASSSSSTSPVPMMNAVAEASSVVEVSSAWEEKYSEKHKKKFWKNKTTGESTWKDPTIALSSAAVEDAMVSPVGMAEQVVSNDWEEKYSEKHKKKFWKNKVTGESSWKDPTPSVKSAPPPPPPPPPPRIPPSSASASKPQTVDHPSVAISPVPVKPRSSLLLTNPSSLRAASTSFMPIHHIIWLKESASRWTIYYMSITGSGFELVIDLRSYRNTPPHDIMSTLPAYSISVYRCKAIICNEASCQLKIISAEPVKSMTRTSMIIPTPRSSAFNEPLISPMRKASVTKSHARQSISILSSDDNVNDSNGKGKIFILRCMSYTSSQSLMLAIQRRLLYLSSPLIDPEESMVLLKRTVFQDKSILSDDGVSAKSIISKADSLTTALLLAQHDIQDIRSFYSHNLQSCQPIIKSLPPIDNDEVSKLAIECLSQLQSSHPKSSTAEKHVPTLDSFIFSQGVLYMSLSQRDASHDSMLPWSSYCLRVDYAHHRVIIHEQSLNTRPILLLDLTAASSVINIHAHDHQDDDMMSYEFCFDGVRQHDMDLASAPSASSTSPSYRLHGQCQNKFEYLQWRMILSYLCSRVPISFIDTSSSMMNMLKTSSSSLIPSIHMFWSPSHMMIELAHACRCLAIKAMIQSSIISSSVNGQYLHLCKYQLLSNHHIFISSTPRHIPRATNYHHITSSSTLSEGSLILGVDAISSSSTSSAILMKYLDDVPRQHVAKLLILRYPREEHHHLEICCSIIETSCMKKVSHHINTHTSSSSSSSNAMTSAAAIAAAVKAVKFDDDMIPRSPTGRRASFTVPVMSNQDDVISSMPITTNDPFGKNVWIAGSIKISYGMIRIHCKSSSTSSSSSSISSDVVDAVIMMPIRRVTMNVIYIPSFGDHHPKTSSSSYHTSGAGGIAVELICRATSSSSSSSSGDRDDTDTNITDSSSSSMYDQHIISRVVLMHHDVHTMIRIITSLTQACMIAGNVPVDIHDVLDMHHRYHNGDLITKKSSSSSSVSSSIVDSSLKHDLFEAAESLQSLLSSFHIIPSSSTTSSSFPSISSIIDKLRDLKHMNSANHLLLMETMLLQAQIRYNSDAQADYGFINSKYHHHTSSSSHRNSISSSHSDPSSSSSADDVSGVVVGKMKRGSTSSTRSSISSLIVEAPASSTDADDHDTEQLSSSSSSSFEPSSTLSRPNMMKSSIDASSSSSSSSKASSSSSAADTNHQYTSINRPVFGLTDQERKCIYHLIDYVKHTPSAIISLMMTMDIKTQHTFTRILVTRVFCPLSTDQTPLLYLLQTLSSASSSSGYLHLFLEMIYRRSDVEAFLIKLCDDLITPSNLITYHHTAPSSSSSSIASVHDTCTKVIEPLFHRLLDAMTSGGMPAIIQRYLLFLSQPLSSSSPMIITAHDVLLELCKRAMMRCYMMHCDHTRHHQHHHTQTKHTRSKSPSSSSSPSTLERKRPSIVAMNKLKLMRQAKPSSSSSSSSIPTSSNRMKLKSIKNMTSSAISSTDYDDVDDNQDLLVDDDMAPTSSSSSSSSYVHDMTDDHVLSVSCFTALDQLHHQHHSMNVDNDNIFIAAIMKTVHLVQLCLNQDGYYEHDHMKPSSTSSSSSSSSSSMLLCLSDAAALSRSKSLASTLSQLLLELSPTSPSSSSPSSSWSPVSNVAHHEPGMTRPMICDDITCMHVEELLLILHVCCYDMMGYDTIIHSYASHPITSHHTPSSSSSSSFLASLSWLHQSSSSLSSRLSSSLMTINHHHHDIISNDDLINNMMVVMIYADHSFHIPINSSNHVTVMPDSLIESHDIIIAEDSAGATMIASIIWLLTACRESIMSVYDASSSSSALSAKIYELHQLRESLSSKAAMIRCCMMDIRRLDTCSSLLRNIRQQLALIIMYHKQLIKASSSSSGGEKMIISASQHDGIIISPAMSLANIIAVQYDLESQLAHRYTPTSSSSSASSAASSIASRVKHNPLSMSITAIRQQLTYHHHRPMISSPPPSPSSSAAVAGSPKRSQAPASSMMSPNPLWTVMKNVFPASPTHTAPASQ